MPPGFTSGTSSSVPSATEPGGWLAVGRPGPAVHRQNQQCRDGKAGNGQEERASLQELTAEILAKGESPRPQVSQLLNRMVEGGLEVQVVFTAGNWLDVDSLYDVIQASKFKGR